jgi:hypothetical protein
LHRSYLQQNCWAELWHAYEDTKPRVVIPSEFTVIWMKDNTSFLLVGYKYSLYMNRKIHRLQSKLVWHSTKLVRTKYHIPIFQYMRSIWDIRSSILLFEIHGWTSLKSVDVITYHELISSKQRWSEIFFS